jgi:hypothetical protein
MAHKERQLTMRFMVFIKFSDDVGDPPPELVDAMSKAIGGAFADGSMVFTGGLYPLSESTEIRVEQDGLTVVDGPYAEAKEVAGGFAIIDVRDPDEALESARQVAQLHRDHWPAWRGAIEVRRIAGHDDAG